MATFNLVLQESLETQLGKPDILTADLSKIEVGLLKQKENNCYLIQDIVIVFIHFLYTFGL